MSAVDVYAGVPSVETDLWQNIATVGLSLDKNDFLDTSYAIDEDILSTQPGSQSTPDSTRVMTRSATTTLPRTRRGKRPIHEEDEDEEEEEEDDQDTEGTQEDVGGLEEIATPGARASQTILGSSASSGLHPSGVQTVNSETPVSKPAKKKRKVDPMQTLSESLAYVLKQQEEMRREQKEDRDANRYFQMTSNKNFQGLAEAFLEEQRLNREERQSNRIMWQDYLDKNQAQPVAALPPASTSQRLQIGLNPSVSNNSAVSVPQRDALAPPPLPVEHPDSTPPPPPARDTCGGQSSSSPQRVNSASEGACVGIQAEMREDDHCGSDQNLSMDPQEVVPGSGINRANDSPAGCTK
jgi:hypothetical protein